MARWSERDEKDLHGPVYACLLRGSWILEAVEDRQDYAMRHLLWEHCSARKLEPVLSSIHRNNQVSPKPDHIAGLQNMKILNQLDTATKEEINKLQRQYRAPVIRWE